MPDITAMLLAHAMPRLRCALAVLAAAASLTAVSPLVPPFPDVQVSAVRLISNDSADSPLGDGTALIMGGSGDPVPPAGYVDAVDTLYLQPQGFTGTPQVLSTPELYYPGNVSEADGAEILATAIQNQIASGQVDAANPVGVFGYSQSAAFTALTMEQLNQEGVPSDDVHFILVGNAADPNGGLVELADIPSGANLSFPALGLTLGHPTPDLYPTDVYTLEYDGYADFPRYPLDLLSDLNALAGTFLEHLAYLGLSPEQIANAIPLETTADDTLTHYYMIPAQTLPLLDLLRLFPVVGNPLADLLEPDMRVLVNLGYGSITDGWNQGPADVLAPFELTSPNINWADVLTALVNGASQGIQAAFHDLQDLTAPILDSPPFSTLLTAAERVYLDNPNLSWLADLLNSVMSSGSTVPPGASFLTSIDDLTGSFSDTSAPLLPIADTIAALGTTLPA